MARAKEGSDWFKHDRDMRNDPKILALRARFGFEGYGVWCMILESLCDTACFCIPWDEDSIELYAGDYRLEGERLTEIAAYMQKVKLLEVKEGKLQCPKLTERLKPLIDKREREQERYQVRISAAESGDSAAESTQIRLDKSRVDKINKKPPNPLKGELGGKKPKTEKPKKPTVREGIQVLPSEVLAVLSDFDNPAEAREIWVEYLLYKHDEHGKRYKTPKSQAIGLRQLLDFADGKSGKARQVVAQSMGKGWVGLFELEPAISSSTRPNANGQTPSTYTPPDPSRRKAGSW